MLNIFSLANGRLFQEEISSLEALSRFQPIWVDLESPTPEEKRWISQHFDVQVPEDAMDDDIEESARFYEEDNGELHIRSDFLIADIEEPRAVRVAFILNQHNASLKSHGVLFSVHDEDLPVFRLLRLRARRAPGLIEDAKDVLLELFSADAEYSADTLEGIYDELEKVSKKVLSGDVTDELAGIVLAEITRQADILVAAVGRPGTVTADMVKPGATVIDVGTSPTSDRQLVVRLFGDGSKRLESFDKKGSTVVGDVHPGVWDVAGAMTPVPGGVGPLTIAMLMANTVELSERRQA